MKEVKLKDNVLGRDSPPLVGGCWVWSKEWGDTKPLHFLRSFVFQLYKIENSLKTNFTKTKKGKKATVNLIIIFILPTSFTTLIKNNQLNNLELIL